MNKIGGPINPTQIRSATRVVSAEHPQVDIPPVKLKEPNLGKFVADALTTMESELIKVLRGGLKEIFQSNGCEEKLFQFFEHHLDRQEPDPRLSSSQNATRNKILSEVEKFLNEARQEYGAKDGFLLARRMHHQIDTGTYLPKDLLDPFMAQLCALSDVAIRGVYNQQSEMLLLVKARGTSFVSERVTKAVHHALSLMENEGMRRPTKPLAAVVSHKVSALQ